MEMCKQKGEECGVSDARLSKPKREENPVSKEEDSFKVRKWGKVKERGEGSLKRNHDIPE